MPYIVADRVKETTTVTGTGPATLAGAASGYRSFASQLSIGDTCAYVIVNSNASEWETGIGTYSAVNTLTRTTIHASTNANAAVVFTAGVKDVFMAPTANTILSDVTSTDGSVTINQTGTISDLSVAVAAAATNVVVQVRNNTGAVLTKGTVVYIDNAIGQLPTVAKALATTDNTSAQTLGMISADLNDNANGFVTIIGLITGINTQDYDDGDQLYLSDSVAGTFTNVKPLSPSHLVYVGIVEYKNPSNGKIFVKVQNGYELDELHNVAAQSPSNGQTIVYNSSNQLWEKNYPSLTNALSSVPVVSGAGNNLTFTAGSGVTSGAGGSLILQAGVQATSGGDGKVIVKQVAGQTSNLQEWQSSSGNIVNRITRLGGMVFPFVSDTTPSGSNEVGLYNGNGQLVLCSSTSRIAAFGIYNGIGQLLVNSAVLGWSAGTALTGGNFSADCGFRRNAAGIIQTAASLNSTAYCSLIVGAYTASTVGLKVVGAASQTANLQEWQDNSGRIVAYVNASGALYDNAINAVPLPTAATVTAATGNGTTVTYTAANTFSVGQVVSITGLTTTTGSSLNLSNQTITTASATQFTITNATVGTAAATQAGTATIQSAGNSVTITAGNGSGGGAGGSIILRPGLQGTSGGNGVVRFYSSAGVATGFWDPNTSTLNGGDTMTLSSKIRFAGAGYIIGQYGLFAFSNSNSANSIFVTLPDQFGFRMQRNGFFGFNNDVFGTNWTSSALDSGIGRADFGVTCVVRDTSKNGGSLSFPSTTTAFSANTNDLALTASAFQRINCTSAASLTGIAPPSGGTHVDGRMIRIYNVGTANLTLAHNSASSAAANRMFSSTGADIILAPNDYAELIYDATSNGSGAAGWRVS
jgi:hypothetical protein